MTQSPNPRPPRPPSGYLSRRQFLIGTGSAVAAGFLVACGGDGGSGASSTTRAAGRFEFTDDRGKRVVLDKRPERIVAYSPAAAALWDFGVRTPLVGVFGPQKGPDGKNDPQIGEVDLGKVQSMGAKFGEFDVERFAAVKPDLLVTVTFGTGGALWYVQEDAVPKVESLAQSVVIKVPKKPGEVVERFRTLAGALGADLDSPAAIQARRDFERAADELRNAARAKPGLKVLALTGGKEQVFVAKPSDWGDLAYFRELGVDVVVPGGSDEFFEALSWEQANKYPADLILYDDRSSFWLTPEQMSEFPTWRQLPAVQKGQLTPWRVEPPFSHQSYTKVFRELTDAVNKARADLVA